MCDDTTPYNDPNRIPLVTLDHNSLEYKRECFHPADLLVKSAAKRVFIGP